MSRSAAVTPCLFVSLSFDRRWRFNRFVAFANGSATLRSSCSCKQRTRSNYRCCVPEVNSGLKHLSCNVTCKRFLHFFSSIVNGHVRITRRSSRAVGRLVRTCDNCRVNKICDIAGRTCRGRRFIVVLRLCLKHLRTLMQNI